MWSQIPCMKYHMIFVRNFTLQGASWDHFVQYHYSDIMMSAMASQITWASIVCLTVCSGADQRKHQSSASLSFVRGIHWWPVDSPHKGPVTRKMFPFDDVIMCQFSSSVGCRGWETSACPLANVSENLDGRVENRPGQVEFCIGYIRDCPVWASAKKF